MRETLSDKLKRWVVTWLPAILGWFGLKHLLDRLLEPLQRQVWAAGLFRQFRRKLPRQHGDAALLRAEHGIVQFGHRDPALRELQAWCENASVGQIEWKLVTGPSGRGKTRLLMELVENMTAAGKPWRAGFLDTAKVRANPDHLNHFARVPENLLFVIDYAERFRDVILALGEAQEVIAERKNNPLVRVILVSRRDSELWTTLASQSKALGDLFENSPLTRLNLRPIAADLESRRKVFEDAFASFAKHFGKKMPVGVTPDLSAAELEDAFYIHAAALLAYRGELDRDLPVQRK